MKEEISAPRKHLTPLLRSGSNTITISLAATTWGVSYEKARNLLRILNNKGWIKRVKAGIYIPIPLEANPQLWGVEDPWVLAQDVFRPCYIGGWDAANYWDLTEQLFQKTWVYTTQPVPHKSRLVGGIEYRLTHIPDSNMFGIVDVKRNNSSIPISDPTRTVVDFLEHMEEFGGIASTEEVLKNYIKSPHKNIPLLLEYTFKKGNRTILKRAGFLLNLFEALSQKEEALLLNNLSTGYSQLCSNQPGSKIVTKWRIKAPISWKKKYDSKIRTH